MLIIKNLDVYYDAIQALRDVSIAIESSEIVTIIGANGAGKSTLLKTIAGALKPRKGAIRLNDGEGLDAQVYAGVVS